MEYNHIEKRFGTIAIQAGFITTDQLNEAMAIQISENLEGTHRLIGQILIEKGYITHPQIKSVLEDMGIPKRILQTTCE